MLIDTIVVGPFQENCYLVADEGSGECVLIDPGDEWSRIAAAVRETGCDLTGIWLTHAHLDHIGALAGLLRIRDVPVYLHEADLPMFAAADRQAAWYGLQFEAPPLPGHRMHDGLVLRVGAHEFTAVHTPGHAPGHVILVGAEHVFGGDLVFRDSIGRTDLPLSDPQQMVTSLERFARLPHELVVYPGHGPATTVGRELAANPFLNGVARVAGA